MSNALIKIWFAFFLVAFLLSLFMLSYIQIRAAVGGRTWRVFLDRPFLDLYWRSLSIRERLLLWPGIIAFVVTWVAGAIIIVLQHLTR